MGSAYQFHSWRVFVIVCALPCVSSVVALTFMPESPRFLLEVMPVDTESQEIPAHWQGFFAVSREVCLPCREVHSPFLPRGFAGFDFMETCFKQRGLTAKTTHALPSGSSFHSMRGLLLTV